MCSMSSNVSGAKVMIRKINTNDNGLQTSYISWKVFSYIQLLILFVLYFLFPVQLYSKEKAEIKVVAVISGDEIVGKLNKPSGLFFDEIRKRLYVADSGNNRLISFDSEFKFLNELSHEELILPTSIVRNKVGHFFILDNGKADIIFIDLEKKVVEPLSLTGIPPGKEKFVPGRIAIDKANRLYIIDKLNKRLLIVEQTGKFVREITVKDKNFLGLTDVRVDNNGDIYAVDAVSGSVYVFDNKGEMVSRFGGRASSIGTLRFPVSLAIDKNGLIYVVDQHAGKVSVFDRKGSLQYTIAKPGVKEGELSNPSYIFIDREGRIYLIDGNRIQVFKE